MDAFKEDILNFIVNLATTLLSFFNGTDVELSEDMISGIENFIGLILGA